MLKDFLVRLQVYNQEGLPAEMRIKLAEILAVFIDIIARATKKVERGIWDRFTSFGRNVLLGSDKTLQDLVKKLDAMTSSETKLVIAETYAEARQQGQMIDWLSKNISDNQQAVENGISTLRAGLQQIDINQNAMGRELLAEIKATRAETKMTTDQEMLIAVRTILNPSFTASNRYMSISKARAPGTGEWVKDHKSFKTWINDEDSILWVSGNPGAGKSFIAGSIIAHLSALRSQGIMKPQTTLAYFFLKDDNPLTRSFHQAVRDLAYQVCESDEAYARYIANEVGSASAIHTTQLAWKRLFLDYFSSANGTNGVYLVIDGMDGASSEDRDVFMTFLPNIIPAHTKGNNFIVAASIRTIEC